jgi:hypothetical protein
MFAKIVVILIKLVDNATGRNVDSKTNSMRSDAATIHVYTSWVCHLSHDTSDKINSGLNAYTEKYNLRSTRIQDLKLNLLFGIIRMLCRRKKIVADKIRRRQKKPNNKHFSLSNYSNTNLSLRTELNQRKHLIYKLKRRIKYKTKIQLNQRKK